MLHEEKGTELEKLPVSKDTRQSWKSEGYETRLKSRMYVREFLDGDFRHFTLHYRTSPLLLCLLSVVAS